MEHARVKDGHAIDLSRADRFQLDPAPVCATGGKPSTRLPPGELEEQLEYARERQNHSGALDHVQHEKSTRTMIYHDLSEVITITRGASGMPLENPR